MSVSVLVGRNGTLIPRLEIARSALRRMRGYIGRHPPGPGTGILLDPCPGVHTWFMRFRIDVIFVDNKWKVERVFRDVAPCRMVWGGRRARRAVECEAGWLPSDAVKPGDTLNLRNDA